jgi:hypothetical protein
LHRRSPLFPASTSHGTNTTGFRDSFYLFRLVSALFPRNSSFFAALAPLE